MKRYIEDNLCKELNLMMVEVPLIVDEESGVNDLLDRDGSRTPIGFHISNDRDKHPINAQVVQAATKWKRMALKQFGMQGRRRPVHRHARRAQGLFPRSRSQRLRGPMGLGARDDARTAQPRLPERRRQQDLEGDRRRRAICAADVPGRCEIRSIPTCRSRLRSCMPRKFSTCIPDLPRKQRETAILQKYPAVFIIGIGWMLKDGYPHEMRAADYDDWVTPTLPKNGHLMHGLNGDILVWNPVTKRRHELSSMGIRVNAESLKKQLELTHQIGLPEVSLSPGDREP